jgi:histidyl-tRNA synthetase
MKPSTPKGTRDFLPQVVQRRNYIFNTIKAVFEKYGYQPIETPAMENLETLMGKYGEEGDRLVFKIMERGEKLMGEVHGILKHSEALQKEGSNFNTGLAQKLVEKFADSALRYDLTVPFARFVVQHQNDLAFPFRRYQIQPVWRADRPQKGRYREFYQCDADVVGTPSLRCEVEYVQIFDEVFTTLGLPVEVRINNRKLLAAMASWLGEPQRVVPLTVAIDKLDKQPMEAVLADLSAQGFTAEALDKLQRIFDISRKGQDPHATLDAVEALLGHLPEGETGIRELRYIFSKIDIVGVHTATLTFDLSLARGLNYYTGAIFEVRPRTTAQVGSICGGGRYDDLTGIFGRPGLSGVGISFGADRIYDLLEAENLWPEHQVQGTKLLFVHFGEAEADFCHDLLTRIRKAGISAELYPDAAKMQKQLKYANDKHIPYVALVGQSEIAEGLITLKNMESGVQESLTAEALIKKLS